MEGLPSYHLGREVVFDNASAQGERCPRNLRHDSTSALWMAHLLKRRLREKEGYNQNAASEVREIARTLAKEQSLPHIIKRPCQKRGVAFLLGRMR